MNKKQTASIVDVDTPKAVSKNVRTLSHNSSSSSMKGKINGAKILRPVGK